MVVSCLYVLFEALSFVFCIHYLYNKKVKFNMLTISYIILEITWMQIVTYFQLDNNLSLLIYFLFIVYCGLQFGFKPKAIFVNGTLCVFFIGLTQATVILLFYYFSGVNNIGIIESVAVNGVTFIIVLKGMEKLKIGKIGKSLMSNDKITFLSLLAVTIGIIFFVAICRYDNGLNPLYYILVLVSLILIIVVAVDIGKHKLRAKEMEVELKLHKVYQDSYRGLIDDIRARQHEFDNHINTIYSQHFIYHTYEELVEAQRQYCKGIVDLNRHNKLLSTGNSIVLGFLYTQISKAEKLGIDVEHKISIGDFACNVPIYKIVELLGNLINNAIEALVQKENSNKLKIIIIENNYEIAIDISNECKNIAYDDLQKFFRKGYSEKGENRGYGLYNVKKICDEYDITLETTLDDVENNRWVRFMLLINKPL